ncbi:MAG TPA: class I SAM-dependent methyltransferase [Geminicoccaceae bacterium]|nr:class I SAM-dependent methyltransferase [Geminicoccaceae bacterium]
MTPWQRLAYDLAQATRVAWFLGHSRLAGQLSPPLLEPVEVGGALPTRAELLRDLFALLRQDRANIAAGLYRLPDDLAPDPRAAWRASRRFLADLGRVGLRRRRGGDREVAGTAAQTRYPAYYLRNFHYQTDGYLSERSAELYDFQVEVLFNGAADAMRRQALAALAEYLRGRRLADQPLLDVACGTGRFLRAVKHNYPRLPVVGLDLSRPYLAEARRALARWSWVRLVEGAAERLPFADASFAAVTSIYLLHELPRRVRAQAVREMARVLRPGGLLVLVDSLQLGDEPAFDGLLDLFPAAYHEPYYADYVRHDVVPLLASAGLRPVERTRAHMSKIVAAAKPQTPGGTCH